MNQNHKNGVNSRGQRNLEIDLRGVCGELAVCKHFNSYPDFIIGPHFSGYDLTVNNVRIDVKTTKYDPGYIQAHLKKKPTDCDVFMMVHDANPNFRIVGWISSSDLLQQSNIKDTGYGEKYIMEGAMLRSIDEFCDA